jgi:hypothetical protein
MAILIYRERIPEFSIPGHPLGRHIHTDSRSELYPFVPYRTQALAPVLWTRHTPILDQGQMGSCVGNAFVGAIGSSPLFEGLPASHPALDEAEAVKVYCLAVVDGQGVSCSTDPGSDGIDGANAAKKLGLIGGYTHCTDLPTMQQALMQGPVCIGINWYDSFDNPSSTGMVSISKGAQVRGGHEVVVVGMDPGTQIFAADNSWSTSWGLNGTFQFSFATMTRLLSESGDCTVPLPDSVIPTPPPPPSIDNFATEWGAGLPTGIQAWCRMTRTRPDLVILKQQLQAAAAGEGLPL